MLLPRESPVMVLPGATLFPRAMLPLRIFEPRYRAMLDDSLADNRIFCVTMRKPGVKRESPSAVGGLGLIRACVRQPDGTSLLVLEGLTRVQLGKAIRHRPYRVHAITPIPPSQNDHADIDTLVTQLRKTVAKRLNQGFQFSPPPGEAQSPDTSASEWSSIVKDGMKKFSRHLARITDPEQLVDLISCALLTNPGARQAILETSDLSDRLRHLIRFLRHDIATDQLPHHDHE